MTNERAVRLAERYALEELGRVVRATGVVNTGLEALVLFRPLPLDSEGGDGFTLVVLRSHTGLEGVVDETDVSDFFRNGGREDGVK